MLHDPVMFLSSDQVYFWPTSDGAVHNDYLLLTWKGRYTHSVTFWKCWVTLFLCEGA